MRYVHVKKATIPALGFGTWQLKGQEAQKMVEKALEIGYRHIDTAQIYGNEAEVGQGLRQLPGSRENLFVTTKVWFEKLSKKNFLPSTEKSLEKLGLGYVDLLLIHWPNPNIPMQESVEELMKAKEKGYTKSIGVSNFLPKMVDEVIDYGAEIITNQVEYHPFLNQSEVLKNVRQHGISLTAYSPLARGEVTDDQCIKEIADKHHKTAAQVSLRWLLQQEDVVVIPKTGTEKYAEENFQIFDFELSAEEMNQIFELNRANKKMVDPDFAPAWDYS